MKNKMMKKVAIVLGAAMLAVTGPACIAHATDGEHTQTEYVNVNSFLAVRTAPDVNAPQVGELHNGQDVEVSGYTNGWAEINYNGRKSYVCANYLSSQKPANSNLNWLKTDSNTATKREYRVHVDHGYLALRTTPTFDSSNEIAQLQNGTKIELINNGEGTYWSVRVPSTNQTGYVNSNYLV